MAYLNNIQLRILVEFLDSPARPEGTMSLHELRGFLWGIASSPADVDEEHWLSFVFNGEEPGFRDEQEEENIYTLILGLWDEQLTRMEDEETPFPGTDYAWHADPSERWPLTDWCNGFLKGHYWQEEVWNELLDVTEPVETEDGIFDIVQEVDSTLDVAAVFADVEGALEDAEDPAELLASLPELAGQLPWIMMNYAECGSLLGELLDSEEQEPFRREQPKIGRNDPCYCGSGKKYKHCCLHAANDD